MKSYIQVDLRGNVLFVPANLASKLTSILEASTLCSSYWSSAISDYAFTPVDNRTSSGNLDVFYTELPSADSFDPASQWYRIRERLDEAEALIKKHEVLIRAAEELDPRPEEDDAPF